ncbi:MAG TPA: hypothetical protein VMA13_08070, partial [Candidatus Saccharimonadales bacterium]|nr:hypothetical protein [Candidatus Saccharimonadales bacterium]
MPLTNSIPVSGCQVQVTVSNAFESPATVQYSTNLVNWVNLFTTNLPSGSVTLTVPVPLCGIGYVRVRCENLCPVFGAYPGYFYFADPADGSPVIGQGQILTIYNNSSSCPLNFNAVCSPWLIMTNGGNGYTSFSG